MSQQIDVTPNSNARSAVDSTTTTKTTTAKNKGGRPKSDIWDHFTTFHDEDGRKGKCNYCGKVYFCEARKHDTSNLWNHVKCCKKHPCSEDIKQTQIALQPLVENMGGVTNWRFDQEFCRKKLSAMIIKDELAFKFVEGKGFLEFVAALQPKFKVPSRWTVSRDCYQLYLNEKVELRDFFQKSCTSVCITTDTWTSVQRLNYLCITAHWIDKDWILNKRIINFCIVDSHKGDEMSRQLDGCLRDWGIARVFSCTVDNAASNDVCVKSLKKLLTSRGCTVVQGKFLHMRCVAHILNLIVGDGLSEIHPTIKIIRDAIRFVRNSPSRLVKFKECCEEEKIDCKKMLCLDVPTRWNSTYLMLDVACKFEKAFEVYEFKDPYFRLDLGDDGVPSEQDWVHAKKMVDILVRFYHLTIRVSGSLYVTSNTFFHEVTTLLRLLKGWLMSTDIVIRSMAEKMKLKYDKYWGDLKNMNELLFLGVIVDPRYKWEFLEFACEQAYGVVDGPIVSKRAWNAFIELYDAYKLMYQPQSDTTMEDQPHSPSESSVEEVNYMSDIFKKRKIQSGESIKNYFEAYLKESVEAVAIGKEFNLLNWWKINQLRFPILSHLARDILSVPISTVASESAFSAGGRVLDDFRSSLTPKIVETLICTQDWLRRPNECISIEEDIDGLVKHEEGMKDIINAMNEQTAKGVEERATGSLNILD